MPDGSTGQPHFQGNGQKGHTFYSAASAAVAALITALEVADEIDPFRVEDLACAELDCDGNGVGDHVEDPDYVDPWAEDEEFNDFEDR